MLTKLRSQDSSRIFLEFSHKHSEFPPLMPFLDHDLTALCLGKRCFSDCQIFQFQVTVANIKTQSCHLKLQGLRMALLAAGECCFGLLVQKCTFDILITNWTQWLNYSAGAFNQFKRSNVQLYVLNKDFHQVVENIFTVLKNAVSTF